MLEGLSHLRSASTPTIAIILLCHYEILSKERIVMINSLVSICYLLLTFYAEKLHPSYPQFLVVSRSAYVTMEAWLASERYRR